MIHPHLQGCDPFEFKPVLFLYHARAINNMMLVMLRMLAMSQARGSQATAMALPPRAPHIQKLPFTTGTAQCNSASTVTPLASPSPKQGAGWPKHISRGRSHNKINPMETSWHQLEFSGWFSLLQQRLQ